MVKRIYILFLLLSIITINIKAQTVPSPSEAYINLELVNPETIPAEVLDTLLDPMNLLTSSDTLQISTTIILVDTNVVSKIHIKLGSTIGANDLLAQTFNYDGTNLIAPQSYFREADMLIIRFGEFINSSVFYCEIILEDDLGNLSEITNCQSDQ